MLKNDLFLILRNESFFLLKILTLVKILPINKKILIVEEANANKIINMIESLNPVYYLCRCCFDRS